MALHVQFLCYLIFCSAFVKYLFHILGRFRTWYNFCRTQICVGVICYFFAISLAMFCFILWSGLFECNILTKTFCFVVFAMVFVIYFARISGCFFFTAKSECYSNLYLFILVFSCNFYAYLHLRFWYVHTQAICNPYTPKIMLISLSVWFVDKANFGLIYLSWICVAKYCPTHLFVHIFLLFCVPSCLQILPLPSAYIIAPMHPPAKLYACTKWIWLSGGNFPAIRPKTCAVYQYMCMLPLFFCPPATLYPIAPIRTHPRPFGTICTRPNPKLYCIYVLFMLI